MRGKSVSDTLPDRPSFTLSVDGDVYEEVKDFARKRHMTHTTIANGVFRWAIPLFRKARWSYEMLEMMYGAEGEMLPSSESALRTWGADLVDHFHEHGRLQELYVFAEERGFYRPEFARTQSPPQSVKTSSGAAASRAKK